MNAALILCGLLASSPTPDSGQLTDEELTPGVRAMVAQWSGDDTPGGAICVLRGDQTIVLETFGMANLEEPRAISAQTPFYIASVAKIFTARAVLHAAQAGKLDIDSPLNKHFPELPATYAGATLRQALHHTSGVIDLYDAVIMASMPRLVMSSNLAAVEFISRFPGPSFEPGSRFLYSNSGYILLAEALHRSTQQDLPTYAAAVIFEPLGMRTASYLGSRKESTWARSYETVVEGWKPAELRTGTIGPGGLALSVEDLANFARALRKELADEPDAECFRAPPAAIHATLGAYGAGWMLQHMDGLRVQRHFGAAFGYSADLLRFPDHDVTIMVLSNAADLPAKDISEAIARFVLGDAMEAARDPAAVAIELEAEDRGRFGVLWRAPGSGEVFVLSQRAKSFTLAALGDLKLRLVPVSPTRLESTDAQIPVSLEFDGMRLVLTQVGSAPQSLERMPFPPTGLPPASELAGLYTSDTLLGTIEFEDVGRGYLKLKQEDPLLVLPPFMPMGRDLYFSGKGAIVEFHRGEDGSVIGLTANANRAWGLELERVN